MVSLSSELDTARAAYDDLVASGLALDLQRGQPSDADFDLSNDLLSQVVAGDTTVDGIELRNYPGGLAGLPSARALFADYLDVPADNVLVWNNSSLELQGLVLGFALLHGVPGGERGWALDGSRPKMIVTVPGYDRHFLLLERLGFDLLSVPIADDGPDVLEIERLAGADPSIKGLLFVPTYSNPTGDSISADKARALAEMTTAAPDFRIFADDAYRGHHLSDDPDPRVEFLSLCAEAGNPNRPFVFASTSKITFAGAGLGFLATSAQNLAWVSRYLGAQSIGPNKIEQARHVAFLSGYPGGIAGLMRAHAELIAPKFAAVNDALTEILGPGGGGWATWREPRGGYFVSLDTVDPVADRVVELAAAAGIKLTPAGATYPGGDDPGNTNIRLAPTRPPLDEVVQAMKGVAVCIRLAGQEYRASQE
ncbi:MAG: aminotransferase class I/II-fold pyridoxal phosphate-dependent enzyme [Actinomycetales bacterium]